MDITIYPALLQGEVTAVASKSQAHRLLICAALADKPTKLLFRQSNRDIDATADCLRAMGATITRSDDGFTVFPIEKCPERAVLPCGESGSTLRFLLPVAGAFGMDATFRLEGRLPQRPLSPLWEEMERMGCTLTRPDANSIRCTGKLRAGEYKIDGGVSSQFISGLLFSTALTGGSVCVTGLLQSQPYVTMTQQALRLFDAPPFHSPGVLRVEGDWSAAAFFLAAQALGNRVRVTGLNQHSAQGDRAVTTLLPQLQQGCPTIGARDIPDLVPVLAVAAAALHGALFTGTNRLRTKESDRVAATIALLEQLGGRAEATEDTLRVFGTGLRGGCVDSCRDHRIAMSAAIAATVCKEPVRIVDAQCVEKSYPSFWAEYRRLGGNYEQHLR